MIDFIPVLSGGQHDTPEEGACVMEMVSFLSGDVWTDTPNCTHVYISVIAQYINDLLTDEERHLILSQFDRLFNTSDPIFTVEFEERFTDYLVYINNHNEGIFILNAGLTIGNIPAVAAAQYLIGDLYAKFGAERIVSFLSDVLDIYDEVSGRNTVPVQDLSKLKEIAHV